MSISKATEKAIKKIKQAGFSHIKLELEAELNRGNCDNYDECEACDGRGYTTSYDSVKNEISTECKDCNGEGSFLNSHDFSDEDVCHEYILDNISNEARRAISYSKFYDDGSVDSELTFTIPIDNLEHCIEVINAFQALADCNGGGMDVSGAGMHISVLTSSRYPGGNSLPNNQINNFRNEVTKLLPALFVTGASGNFSREFSYRFPRISYDDKYSAIYTHSHTCIEYRLFETCYQRPEALYEYVGTIAKTLEYYIDPSKKVTEVGANYQLYDNKSLDGIVGTPEQLSTFKNIIKYVKPEGYTIKQIAESRGIDIKLSSVRAKHLQKINELKKLHRLEVENYERLMAKPLTEREQSYYNELIACGHYSPADANERARSIYSRPASNEEAFINNNLTNTSACTICC